MLRRGNDLTTGRAAGGLCALQQRLMQNPGTSSDQIYDPKERKRGKKGNMKIM